MECQFYSVLDVNDSSVDPIVGIDRVYFAATRSGDVTLVETVGAGRYNGVPLGVPDYGVSSGLDKEKSGPTGRRIVNIHNIVTIFV